LYAGRIRLFTADDPCRVIARLAGDGVLVSIDVDGIYPRRQKKSNRV
jgi:hypothetical protein